MECLVISSVAEKLELVVDDDMTIGDVRGVIQAMLDSPDDSDVVMVVNGCTLSDDEAPWRDAMAHCFPSAAVPPKVKIYVRIGGKRKVEMDRDVLRYSLPSKESKEEELNAERERARQMEPMIEQMSKNPQFVEMMMQMQPGLKEMADANPEIGRQLRNPEMLKEMMMSQLHPDRRRDMGRNLELQMSQISAMPGGQQMLDRYMHGMRDDLDRADFGKQSTDDLHETTQEMARPQAGHTSNADALPNPWQTPQLPAQAPASSSFPFGATAAAPNPMMTNPALMQQLMATMGNGPAGWGGSSAVPAVAAPTTAPPQMDYTSQCALMQEMGFEDNDTNLRALQVTSGDVEAAVLLVAEQAEEEENAREQESQGTDNNNTKKNE